MPYNTQIIGGTTNPYNAGAVVVNSEEPVKYFLAQKAHQAALDEAATKHSLDKINDFKPNEIRAVDTPDLLGIVNKYQTHAVGNSKAINNTSIDGGKSYLESKGIYNEVLLHSAKSKAAKLEEKAVADLHLADIKAGRETDPENAAIMDAIAAPVTSAKHYKDGAAMTQPYTAKDWKPYQGYGAKEMAAQLKQYDPIFANNDAFEADGVSTPSVDKTTGKKITIDPFKLSASGMNDVKSVYNADWAGNPSTQTHAKDAFKTISNEVLSTGQSPTLLNLNKTYKEFVGKDLDPRDLKEIGLAQLLSKKSSQLKGIEYNDAGTIPKPDNFYAHKQYEWQHEKGGSGELSVNNLVSSGRPIAAWRIDENKKGTDIKYEGAKGIGSGYKEIVLPRPVGEQFTEKNDKGQVLATTRWMANEDGTKFAPISIQTGEDGKPILKDGKEKILIPKPEDWVDKSQMAQAYQKAYPKGEGNLKTANSASNNTQQTKTVHKRKLGE
jgi:hypothetical protein